MASENNEISDIVKKCKILLLDIEGTTTSISFVKDKLFPYAKANVQEFLQSQWENEDVKEAVAALRKLSVEDKENNVEGVVAIPGEDAEKDEQIEGLVKSVQWQMSADRKAGPLKLLQGLIWKQGYDKGDIKGHVYDDVAPALELWRATEGQKVYIYSSGSVQAQKLLFNLSVAGDLLPHIEGHFDTAVGGKQEAASYVAIAEKIGCKPEEILFLTDILKEAEAARASGLQTALVSREGNAPLPAEAATFPLLHSLEQLTVSNKRKPEPQEEEVPAKVPKTDIEADVKTTSEMEVVKSTPEVAASSEQVAATENIATVETKTCEIEKMDVEDEEVTAAETAAVAEQVEKVVEKAEDIPVSIEPTVEDITKSNGVADAPVSDIKPVIEESVEKTETNETEKMETESTENVETVETAIEPKEPIQEKIDEKSAHVAEETLSVLTVQEVTNDTNEETEVEDLVPIVEEPPSVEMEDLKNVGDVLDKECDEILSKVQDVTNLDSMPIKPMLNSISETMESENGDNTNDIVESILDSEMESEIATVKASNEIDENAVQEIIDIKADILEAQEKQPNLVQAIVEAEEIPEENTNENKPVENSIDEVKVCENVAAVVENKKDNTSTVTAVKKNEISNEPKPDVTNGDIQENKSESVEEKMEMADSVIEPECNVVEETESKQVVEDKPDSKENPTKQADNKMESEESTVPTGNKMDTIENIQESVDDKLVTKESTVEPLDSEMESEDTTDKTAENLIKSDVTIALENKPALKESVVEQADNKMESEDNTVELGKNEAETKERITEQEKNKMDPEDTAETAQNKAETKEVITEPVNNEMESEDNTVGLGQNVTEMKESITEQVANKMESEDNADLVESKTETKENSIEVDSKMVSEEDTPKPADTAVDAGKSTSQESKASENNAMPEITAPENNTENKATPEIVPDAVVETKDAKPNDVQMETEATEKQVNGSRNGEPEVNQNGDASKDEELSARLSSENGEKSTEMNGANGNGSADAEKGQGDNKVEMEVPDIKVKTVGSDETRTDPIEQPVEA